LEEINDYPPLGQRQVSLLEDDSSGMAELRMTSARHPPFGSDIAPSDFARGMKKRPTRTDPVDIGPKANFIC
jgi:hypothetical protein